VRRIAALVVAAALIAGALIVRSNRDTAARRGPYRLTCATELADACHALEGAKVAVTIEPAGTTTDRLVGLAAGADPGFDGWLAAGRWSEMVTDARRAAAANAVTGPRTIVGGGRVAVAVWRSRVDVLRKACGGALNWKCLGDAAARVTWAANGGSPAWGPIKIALPNPLNESAGLAGLAAATAGFIGSTTFVPADLQQNDGYLRWLTSLARSIPQPSPDFVTMLTAGAAVADAYIGLDAEINGILRTAAKQSEVEVVYLSPVVDVDVVLTRAARDGRAEPDGLKGALSGWTKRKTDPNPPATALAGLRVLWRDIPR
jgi:hypothetical protein